MKLQVIVDDGLLSMIEDVCQMYKFDRSEFVRQAIRESIWIHTPSELKDWAIKYQGEGHGKDLTNLRQLVKETEKKYSIYPRASGEVSIPGPTEPVGLKPVEEEPVPHITPPQPIKVKFIFNRAWGIKLCPHHNESGQCPMGCIDEEVK